MRLPEESCDRRPVDSAEEQHDRLEVGVDRGRLSFLAGLLLASGLACLSMYKPWTRPWYLGWLGLAFLPMVLRQRNDPRPLLVLDDDGLSAPRTGLRTVAWSNVRRVRISRFANISHLCVEVDGLDRYLSGLSTWRSLLLTLPMRRNEVRIDLNFADLSPREIFDEVTRRCEPGAFPSGKLWH